jgi:hypothetical protein
MRHLLLLAAALLPFAAFAQKPAPASPLERGYDPEIALTDDGMTQLASGRAAMLVGLNLFVPPGSAEDMARFALEQHSGELGLRAAGSADLEVASTFSGDVGTIVRFRQTVGGVPVWGPLTVVNLDNRKRAQLILNAYRPDVSLADVAPSVAPEDARAAVLAHLGASGALQHDETELVVWPALDGARLAWNVRLVPDAPMGDWEALVDAETGALLRVADRAVNHRADPDNPRTALPVVETHPLFRLDGTGFIFDPDPLTRAGVSYGGGYVDGGDANTPQLEAARTAVTLRDISQDGANFVLRGPWASIQEFEAPNKGIFPRSTPDWSFTRDADGFEAAMTYWHIDNYMRYVNVTLGSPAVPTAYAGGVQFDAHGLSGSDNSHYISSTDRVAFGEGCVDDNEDADVIIHELGHGLHDWLSAISNASGDGLSEGFGDYVAVSYTRSLGLLSPSSPSYSWVFKWDGHNECWGGRAANIAGPYPNPGGLHGAGQNWATSNMRIWNALGRERTDKAVFEGIRLTNSVTRQPAAANAVLQAAANMGYTAQELQTMFSSYQTQGYTGLVMPVSSEDGARPGASAELTAASPNPFNGRTVFELIADREQRVTVDVLDVLGRRVAVLFEGEVRAGQRYPFALDGIGLRAGVYVYRAAGETFTLSRRVTLAD